MVSIGAATYSKETSERRGVIQHLDRVLVCARKRQEGREFEQARVGAGARVPVSAPSETSKGSDVKMPHLSTNQMCNVRMGFGARSAVAQQRGVAHPRKARASNPATPASKRASAAGPPFS